MCLPYSKVAQQSIITTVTPGSSAREEESRLVNKRRRKRTASPTTTTTTSTTLPPIDSNVTICDEEGGTVETLDMLELNLTEIADAKCGFILWEEDSTASCSDLAPYCEDETATTAASGENNQDTDRTGRQIGVSQFPSWKLKWCPGRVPNSWWLSQYPICCFHLETRPDYPSCHQNPGEQMDVWDCLKKYYTNTNLVCLTENCCDQDK